MRRIIIVIPTLTLSFLLAFACGDSGSTNEFDYDKPLGIDTVLARDTLALHDSVRVVYTYPSGCNHLKSLTYSLSGDTVSILLMWNYYYHGAPCAHGSGVDTASLSLNFSSPRGYKIAYVKPDSTSVSLGVTVQ
ncbi:hypothetical protein C3F09_09045 [candidate division GN15 bacterium]|uniref:Uncharacterized protein n=1 Tax=candidate division GN15 bacterium TaxID=2072418 RepID=A0A855X4A0_9BACT|nr:MAG: hypothetical protein C3F09_09045 [candidate division GN15 bacterium]